MLISLRRRAISDMKKVLIIDDEANIIELLQKYFEREGYAVISCMQGDKALGTFAVSCPDLIILDVMMPKINGYKISRLLKYDNKYKDIPIIMVTARSQLEDKMIGEETGVNEYITKPFELDQIVKKVEEYLGVE